MPDVCCPQCSPSSPSRAPCPSRISPEMYIALLVAAPVALILWFRRRNLHRPLMEQLPDVVPDPIPATPRDPEAAAVCSSATPPQAEASDGSCSTSGRDDEEGDDDDDVDRPELPPASINATVDRSGDVAGILNKMLSAFGGIFLDFSCSDESTIHPANGVLIQSIEIFRGYTDRMWLIFGTGDYTTEPYSVMFDCWVSKLEEDAELICRGEKGRMYIFLLNNRYDAWQMMRCPGASFSNAELTSRFISTIQRYKKGYLDECWVPLTDPCRLDKFTSDLIVICDRQMTWKVTAELKYKLRQEIVELILPPYGASLVAVEANRSRHLEILYWIKRAIAGKKKQKKYTVEVLENVIRELFEG